MLSRIIGAAMMNAMGKKLRGGPTSMLPMSPGKGTGAPSGKGVTPQKKREFVTPRQNPFLNPKGRR